MKPSEILMEIAVFFAHAVFMLTMMAVLIVRGLCRGDGFSRQARSGHRPTD